MAGDNKYGVLRKIGVAAAASVGVAMSSGSVRASEVPPAFPGLYIPDGVPVGQLIDMTATTTPINQIDTTKWPLNKIDTSTWTSEQREIFHKVEGDLSKASIPSATYVYPFPDDPPTVATPLKGDAIKYYEDDGRYLYESTSDGKNEYITKEAVIGIARKGSPSHDAFTADPQLNIINCPNNRLKDAVAFERTRILFYLHEMGHKVDNDLGLTNEMMNRAALRVDRNFARIGANPNDPYATELRDQVKADLMNNISERQADGTAVIYAKGNMKNSGLPIKLLYDLRESTRLIPNGYDHDTASTVEAAQAVASRNKPGINFVDAAKQSEKVLERHQEDVFIDYRTQLNINFMNQGKRAELSKEVSKPELDQSMRQYFHVIKASADLCRLGHFGSLPAPSGADTTNATQTTAPTNSAASPSGQRKQNRFKMQGPA